MTTTKTKTRKSGRNLSLGPKSYVCTVQRRIFRWKKKLHIFLGWKTQTNSRGSSKAFFWSRQERWKVYITVTNTERPYLATRTSKTRRLNYQPPFGKWTRDPPLGRDRKCSRNRAYNTYWSHSSRSGKGKMPFRYSGKRYFSIYCYTLIPAGFHMIVRIVLIVPGFLNNVEMIRTIVMETLPRWSQTTRTTETTSVACQNWVLFGRSGQPCKFWSDHMETISDDWDDRDDR